MTESGEPVVTLVLASYNHGPYVRDAIASAAAQTFSGVELIVTDDASRDDSVETIVRSLAEHDLSARSIFHTKNRGICATFNEALALVTTPYVAFLAADDWMEPERFALQVPALEAAPDAGLAYSDMWIGDAGIPPRTERYSEWWGEQWRAVTHGDLFRDLVGFNWIPAPSVLARTQALREVGGYDEELTYEDHDMWLRLARTRPFVYVDQPLVTWRRVAGSLSATLDERDPLARRRHELLMLGKHVGQRADIDSWLEPRVFHLAVEHVKAGDRSPEVARILRRCLRASPGPTRFRRAAAATLATATSGRLRRHRHDGGGR